MKKNGFTKMLIMPLVILLALFLQGGCLTEKDKVGCTDRNAFNYDMDANIDCGCCEYKGALLFWVSTPSYGNINVVINGGAYVSTITGYYTIQPACLSSVGGYFYLPKGTYSYVATAQSGKTWVGNVTVNANSCNRMYLM